MIERRVHEGLLRSLVFYSVLGYPPTRAEWFAAWDGQGEDDVLPTQDLLEQAAEHLVALGLVVYGRGRVSLADHRSLFIEHESRERFSPRKLREAKRAARWLSRLDGVRFVALCNTSALAHGRDQADLDFFIITKAGRLWQTRGWATLPFSLLRRRPRDRQEERDAVCLSFFIDDQSLNLSPLQLPGGDVYFRYWFLSLLPLYDDGVSKDLWQANQALRSRHPFAQPWMLSPDLALPKPMLRIPSFSFLEPIASRLQASVFPPSLRAVMNQDTRVVVNDHILKFHAEDGREGFRSLYQKQCECYGIAP
jgi:hypothetical protein